MEDIVRTITKQRGANENQTLNYKTNLERSNEYEYYVEHLSQRWSWHTIKTLLLFDKWYDY